MSRFIKISLKIAFSLIFFSVLVAFVKSNELIKVFQQIDFFYLFATFLVTVVMVVSSCAKWKTILDLKSRKIPFVELFRIYLVGYFFSNILPSTVGGDVVRSYYVGRKLENQAFSAVAVFLERFSGMMFLFCLVTVVPFIQPELYKSPYFFIPSIAGAGFLLVILWLWFAVDPFYLPDRIAKRFFGLTLSAADICGWTPLKNGVESLEKLYNRMLAKVARFREELRFAMNAVKYDKQFLFRILFLTAVFYLFTWVNVYTAYLAFGVHVDFLKICTIVPAIMIVAYLPVTLLGNLGYFESVFVFYFLFAGVSGAESLAMGLLLRVKMLVIGVIGFVVYLFYKDNNPIDLKNIGRAKDPV